MLTGIHSSTVRSNAVQTESARITTTLYDLIATMHAVLGPEEDEFVILTVDRLLRDGRLTFVENRDLLVEHSPQGRPGQ